MADMRLSLSLLPGSYAIYRLEPDAPAPALALGGGLVSLTRTATELSLVCREVDTPETIPASRGWRCVRVAGPLDFALTGVLAALAVPLAEADISIFAISTYDTDYLLLPGEKLRAGLRALAAAGHHIEQTAKG